MISVIEAQHIIYKNRPKLGLDLLRLDKAFGSILQENIKADRDFPAFDKALMDGIAVNYASWVKGNRQFFVENVQAAGQKALKLKSTAHCIEIMTGAQIPQGCDTVIPYEQILIKNKIANVQSKNILKGQNVRLRASDHKKGEIVLKKGTRLLAPQVAIAAAVGKFRIRVSKNIKMAIVSTGDELVPITKQPKSFQIRISNSYALQAAFRKNGFSQVKIFHIKDNKKELLKKIKDILQSFDVLVLSGGVSKGKFDYVPEVLKELGVTELFHRVNQKPGKPFWFGKKREKLVFGLPGNPISTLICAYRYVIPGLSGSKQSSQETVSLEKARNNSSLTIFLPAVFEKNGMVRIVNFSGSGDLASLGESDGFVELPSGNINKTVNFYRW